MLEFGKAVGGDGCCVTVARGILDRHVELMAGQLNSHISKPRRAGTRGSRFGAGRGVGLCGEVGVLVWAAGGCVGVCVGVGIPAGLGTGMSCRW